MAKGKRQPDQLLLIKPSRAERIAAMDEEILDVEGAARVLGVNYTRSCDRTEENATE